MLRKKVLLGPMRIPFLILAPACVVLGYGATFWERGRVHPLYFALSLLGAITAHISVNALNEYFDFKSSLDFRTNKTPFSGGSGTLPSSPEAARYALVTGLGSLAITVLVGLYFLIIRGLALLPIGLLGVVIILAYTVWLTRQPLFCLIAPGLGFGLLMVMGTHFVLTGEYSMTAFVASLVPFFLVSDLLLLNQFPDIEADRQVGRRHFPILLGPRSSAFIYGAFLLFAFSSIGIGVILGFLPGSALLGLAPVVIAVPTFRGVLRYGEDMSKLIGYMGLNVLLTVLAPVLVAIGLLIG